MKQLREIIFCLVVSFAFAATLQADNGPFNDGDHTLTGTLSGDYKYKGNINSSGTTTVNSGSSATAYSFGEVLLLPGFEAVAGSGFVAKICDDDTMDDDWERTHFGNLNQGPDDDFDNDGLTNLAEYLLGTDPTKTDTDGDGYSDYIESQYSGAPCNMDPLNDVDDDKDCDGDTYTNGVESELGSDPFSGSSVPAKGNHFQYNGNGRVKKIIRIQ